MDEAPECKQHRRPRYERCAHFEGKVLCIVRWHSDSTYLIGFQLPYNRSIEGAIRATTLEQANQVFEEFERKLLSGE